MYFYCFNLYYQNSDEFLSSKFDELLTLMIEVLPLCHFSAKRHRLDCLYFLIVQVTKVSMVDILFLEKCVHSASLLKYFPTCCDFKFGTFDYLRRIQG